MINFMFTTNGSNIDRGQYDNFMDFTFVNYDLMLNSVLTEMLISAKFAEFKTTVLDEAFVIFRRSIDGLGMVHGANTVEHLLVSDSAIKIFTACLWRLFSKEGSNAFFMTDKALYSEMFAYLNTKCTFDLYILPIDFEGKKGLAGVDFKMLKINGKVYATLHKFEPYMLEVIRHAVYVPTVESMEVAITKVKIVDGDVPYDAIQMTLEQFCAAYGLDCPIPDGKIFTIEFEPMAALNLAASPASFTLHMIKGRDYHRCSRKLHVRSEKDAIVQLIDSGWRSKLEDGFYFISKDKTLTYSSDFLRKGLFVKLDVTNHKLTVCQHFNAAQEFVRQFKECNFVPQEFIAPDPENYFKELNVGGN